MKSPFWWFDKHLSELEIFECQMPELLIMVPKIFLVHFCDTLLSGIVLAVIDTFIELSLMSRSLC